MGSFEVLIGSRMVPDATTTVRDLTVVLAITWVFANQGIIRWDLEGVGEKSLFVFLHDGRRYLTQWIGEVVGVNRAQGVAAWAVLHHSPWWCILSLMRSASCNMMLRTSRRKRNWIC